MQHLSLAVIHVSLGWAQCLFNGPENKRECHLQSVEKFSWQGCFVKKWKWKRKLYLEHRVCKKSLLPPCGLLLEWYFLIPRTMCFPGGSVVKSLPAMQETRVQSPGGEDPLEEGTATHSSILAWRISWTEEPGRLQSIGSQGVKHDSSDWAYTHQERWNFGNDPLLKGWFLELPLQFAGGSSLASSFNVYKSQLPPL